MAKRKVHGGREVLNLPGHHSIASFVAEIEDTSTWTNDKTHDGDDFSTWNIEPNYAFAVSDCGRTVSLDISVNSEEDYENSLYKVDIMIDLLNELRDGLIVERRRYIKRKKKLKESKKNA